MAGLPEPIDKTERQRLARAAWAYSGLEVKALADATGIKIGTLRGYIGKGDKPGPDWEDGVKIADACGVPRYLMQYGFLNGDAVDVLSRGLLGLAQANPPMPQATPKPGTGEGPSDQHAEGDGG